MTLNMFEETSCIEQISWKPCNQPQAIGWRSYLIKKQSRINTHSQYTVVSNTCCPSILGSPYLRGTPNSTPKKVLGRMQSRNASGVVGQMF